MPIFVVLSTLTAKGRRTLRRRPERLNHLNLELKDLGFRVLHQYALLGEYDFVTVLEAPSNEAIAHMSMDLGSRETVITTTLGAISLEEFVSKLREATGPGPAHARQDAPPG